VRGSVWRGFRGVARRGNAGCGKAWVSRSVEAWRGSVRCSLAWVSRLGGVRCSLVGSGVVWFGEDFMA